MYNKIHIFIITFLLNAKKKKYIKSAAASANSIIFKPVLKCCTQGL